MVEVHDGLGVSLRLHNLLLALAGRLDDSALTEAREMVARSRLDEAVELVAGALIAGRIPMTADEQRELAAVLELSRSDAVLAGQLTIGDYAPLHRFTGMNDPDRGIVSALDRTLRVLPDLRTVHAVWRNTPSGSVPGPLPQLVVLVTMGADGHPPAAAYRVDAALRRAGIRAVVEVSGPDSPISAYHQAALDVAAPVWDSGSSPLPAAEPPAAPRAPQAVAPAPPIPATPMAPPMAPPMASTASSAASSMSPSASANPPERSGSSPASIPPPPPAMTSSGSSAAPATSSWTQQQPDVPAKPVPQAPPALRALAPVKDLPSRADAAKTPKHEAPKPQHPKAPPKQDLPREKAKEERADRRVSTAELSAAEVTQLRKALAEDPEKGRAMVANIQPHDIVELPALDLDDPQLSDRDRQLLRELHEELAERERAESDKVGANGGDKSKGSWWDGYSGS
ncbi:hypothetical protein CFN78_11090 [Amycolatopsis antarctica]|uniref:Uncharacterized protein n=1 Tax=Amycolatopsis antarctica TaxID=1854586 RepID=A0A263D5R2_9PSEU|nr:hypothetical protein [Amycolatopsis antarctica]OZM73378.1 hypothetical protein CFN78_11090 [Amycolatopsis antarctica]